MSLPSLFEAIAKMDSDLERKAGTHGDLSKSCFPLVLLNYLLKLGSSYIYFLGPTAIRTSYWRGYYSCSLSERMSLEMTYKIA